MQKKIIRKLSILLTITLIAQLAFGLKIFDITVKADQGVKQEETAGAVETTPKESASEQESPDEETSSDITTEEPSTEETTTPEPITEPPTEPPTTVDYEIIDGVYKVKNDELIEYLGKKTDKTVTSLEIPAQVKTIKENVFENCKYIKKVTFANGSQLTKIEMYAFKNCVALQTISLPETLKTIGYKAFGLCTSMEKITIPGSVTYGNQILGTSSKVKTVIFESGMKTIPDNILKNANSVTSISLPSDATSIGKSAFYNCSALKKITIPNTVTVINTSAFYNCSSMTKCTMSKKIATIGKSAFKNCSKLTSVVLYKTITSIGSGAFSGDTALVLKVYANSKGKAYARANKIEWDFTDSEKKRRAANQVIYDEYTKKIKDNDKNKYQLKYLSDYVPQGNCLIGKYLVVSMYHKNLKKRSVLVLYNKSTGAYAKTIYLPYYDHVGGVTNVKGRLVVSLNNISTNDYLAVYSYSKIKKVKNGKLLKPGYRVKLSGHADFSAFDGTYFWAGHSANISYATMQGYKVKIKKKRLVFTRMYSYYIPSNSQGLVVQKISSSKRRFIFSQSYGRINNSALITDTKNIKKSGGLGNATKTLTMPSMLEGITRSSDKYMYMVFESGAGLYCGNPDNTSEIQIRNVCRVKSKFFGI